MRKRLRNVEIYKKLLKGIKIANLEHGRGKEREMQFGAK